MKSIQQVTLALVLLLSIFSCKKNSDGTNTTSNWSDKLKGTTWAGEFNYTTGDFQSGQPFSIDLNSDGTSTWTDLYSTRPAGTWAVDGEEITITFSNATKLSATLHDDVWSNFSNPSANGFNVSNLYIGKHTDPAKLNGTSWSGLQNATPIVTTFLAGNTIQILSGSKVIYNGPYTSEGAGIRFAKKVDLTTTNYFACFIKGLTVKGVAKETSFTTFYFNWNGELVK